MIHIWMNRIGSVALWLPSECCIPEPSVARCTEPGGSTPPLPRESACSNMPSATYVMPSMSRCGCIGQTAPGTSVSSLKTRRSPNQVFSGSA
jgi:hypothetical protein